MARCKLTHPGIAIVATSLEKLPYKKNFSPPITPLMRSIWLTYLGLAGSLMIAAFLSRLSLFDWDTFQRMSEKTGEAMVVPMTARLTIWAFASDPWLGILWGAFVGTLLMLQLNADQHRHLDYYAERMVRQNRISFRGFSDRRIWTVLGWVTGFVLLDVVGAYVLNVSPKTSLPAMLIPAFLSYRVDKSIYELAKQNYAVALDQGLIPNGSLHPSRGQYFNLVFALVGSIAITVCFSIFLASVWSELGSFRDHNLEMTGMTRTPEEAQALEKQLERNPDNRDAHVILAAYYGGARFEVPEGDQDAMRQAYYRHTLWLIEHAPENFAAILLFPRDGEAYKEARRLWQRNIETKADDPRVLINAASFFDDTDPALAEEILRKGQALEPDNPEWKEEITKLHLQTLKRAERDLDRKDVLERIPYNDEDD